MFGIPSFSISVFDGLTVLVPDKLSKSVFKILDEGVSDKTLVGLHLVVRELLDLVMSLNIVLDGSLLFEVIPHPGYTQSGMGTTKAAVHSVGKFLPGVVSRGVQPRVIPHKGKAF